MAPVSVLIPAYKPNFLRQAIASVLAQSFSDYELLISDDCPDDGVKQVVAEFGDRRIRLLEGPRQGLVPNSMFLFEQARGEFLKFVYDDDFLWPFAIDRLGQALVAEPKAGFAFCLRYMVDAQGREIGHPGGYNEGPLRRLTGDFARNYLLSNVSNFIGEPTNILIRKSVVGNSECLRQYAGFRIRHLIDVAFYLNALDRGPAMAVRERLAAFRHHGDQMTSNRNPGFAIGVIEWELMIRHEFSAGRLQETGALEGLRNLDRRYGAFSPYYPEVNAFRDGLDRLAERIQAEDRQLVDGEFLGLMDAADEAVRRRIEDRRAAAVMTAADA